LDHLDLKESAADLDEMVSADSPGQQGQKANQDYKVFLDCQGTKEIVVTKVMLDQREQRDHEACRERMDPQA